MRVLFVNPAAGLGGAERCLLDMLAALGSARPGIERRVLLLSHGPLCEQIAALGAEASVLPLPAALRGLGESRLDGRSLAALALRSPRLAAEAAAYARSFRCRVDELRPDIVHSNGIKAHVLCTALARQHSRVVVHMHDFLGRRRLSRYALRALCASDVSVVAVSKAIALDCAQVLPRARVELVYNAIDPSYFCPGHAERAWLSSLAGMKAPDPGVTTFVLAASYARWKGQDLLLRAVARALSREPRLAARWYIVGGPIYETSGGEFSCDELRSLARELRIDGQVGFVPFVEDVARVFRSADVVVNASDGREAFGRTIVEAMACEKAVIACTAGGAGELFEHGLTALGFGAGDEDALSAAMLRVAGDPELRRSLGRAARAHVLERFDRRRLGSELLGVYEHSLRGGRP
ncbi:MAG TPA: glycosyltransferase family 4 protein [Polyangiaceae bacterium]|nr:glycosyltransferase family 4 protein [Polyangiaceae bacterium]